MLLIAAPKKTLRMDRNTFQPGAELKQEPDSCVVGLPHFILFFII